MQHHGRTDATALFISRSKLSRFTDCISLDRDRELWRNKSLACYATRGLDYHLLQIPNMHFLSALLKFTAQACGRSGIERNRLSRPRRQARRNTRSGGIHSLRLIRLTCSVTHFFPITILKPLHSQFPSPLSDDFASHCPPCHLGGRLRTRSSSRSR